MKEVTQEELDDWKSHPVTQNVMLLHERAIRAIQQSVGEGDAYVEGEPFKTHDHYARAMGKQWGLAFVFDIDLHDFAEPEHE